MSTPFCAAPPGLWSTWKCVTASIVSESGGGRNGAWHIFGGKAWRRRLLSGLSTWRCRVARSAILRNPSAAPGEEMVRGTFMAVVETRQVNRGYLGRFPSCSECAEWPISPQLFRRASPRAGRLFWPQLLCVTTPAPRATRRYFCCQRMLIAAEIQTERIPTRNPTRVSDLTP